MRFAQISMRFAQISMRFAQISMRFAQHFPGPLRPRPLNFDQA
jgi:hypothetical protein